MNTENIDKCMDLIEAANSLRDTMEQIKEISRLFRTRGTNEQGDTVMGHRDGFSKEGRGIEIKFRYDSITRTDLEQIYKSDINNKPFTKYLEEMLLTWLNIKKDDFFEWMEAELRRSANNYREAAMSELEQIKKTMNEIG